MKAEQMEPKTIVPQVTKAIESLGYQCLRKVSCKCVGNTIVLQGVVRSFYFKQISQSAAAKVAGAECIKNEIVVEDSE
jgi:hypothetical protein